MSNLKRKKLNFAMRYWAQQYCRFVRILTPIDLAETVKTDLQGALENYL